MVSKSMEPPWQNGNSGLRQVKCGAELQTVTQRPVHKTGRCPLDSLGPESKGALVNGRTKTGPLVV